MLNIAIRLWKRIVKWKKGCNTSRTVIKRYSKNVGVDWLKVKKGTIEESKKKLLEACTKFNKSKEKFPEWRRHHLKSLIEAKAEEKKISTNIIKTIMKREEASRLLGKKSKRITGKG